MFVQGSILIEGLSACLGQLEICLRIDLHTHLSSQKGGLKCLMLRPVVASPVVVVFVNSFWPGDTIW